MVYEKDLLSIPERLPPLSLTLKTTREGFTRSLCFLLCHCSIDLGRHLSSVVPETPQRSAFRSHEPLVTGDSSLVMGYSLATTYFNILGIITSAGMAAIPVLPCQVIFPLFVYRFSGYCYFWSYSWPLKEGNLTLNLFDCCNQCASKEDVPIIKKSAQKLD